MNPRSNASEALTGAQCRTARAALGWTQKELIDASGVGSTSVKKFETGERLHPVLAAELRRTLEGAGVVFLEPGSSHGERKIALGVILLAPSPTQ